jgi:hypothetical protein
MRTVKRPVLIISHADADGHLIAEQTRRNLALVKGFDVQVLVDPVRTKDHKVWFKLQEFPEIDRAELVFFVDLMFAPDTCVEEAAALVKFVGARRDKTFYLIDHHPLPLLRLEQAENLHVHYRPDVFECAIGPRSGMMVVAALCEKQPDRVANAKQPIHETLARALKRAAALGGPLPGAKLLALLRSNQWEPLVELGEDRKEFHRLPRGRRPVDQKPSKTLKKLDQTAIKLLANGQPKNLGRDAVAYDVDIARERFGYEGDQPVRQAKVNPKDLEAIITLLEVAALTLTTENGDTFALEELINEARELGGHKIDIDERDVKIVLGKQGFLVKVGGKYRLK